VAIKLRKLKECTIITGEYLNVDNLKNIIAQETESPTDLTRIPLYFSTIAHLLLNEAKEDFLNNFLEITKLVDDLESLRRKKIEASLRRLESSVDLIRV
jgi:hypothetical protein